MKTLLEFTLEEQRSIDCIDYVLAFEDFKISVKELGDDIIWDVKSEILTKLDYLDVRLSETTSKELYYDMYERNLKEESEYFNELEAKSWILKFIPGAKFWIQFINDIKKFASKLFLNIAKIIIDKGVTDWELEKWCFSKIRPIKVNQKNEEYLRLKEKIINAKI